MRSLFTALHNLLERQTTHTEMISITWSFRRILVTLQLNTMETKVAMKLL